MTCFSALLWGLRELERWPSTPYTCTDMSSGASTRFEFRVRPETKQQIEHAAGLVHESTSDFVRAAAERRAEEVLRDHDVVTVVPADFFDRLISVLDEPPNANAALKRASTRARVTVQQ